MDDIIIPGSSSTPSIETNGSQGVLRMAGDSYPENSFEFFNHIIRWVEQFLSKGEHPLRLDLRLNYLNTSSVKAMLDIFDLLQDAHDRKQSVQVDWFFNALNERVEELAEEFREDYTFPFNITAE